MSVVGFDLGNESCVVAAAFRGAVQTLQNEVGKRKTVSLVAYGEQQRFLGNEAVSQVRSNVKNSLEYFKNFLGLDANNPNIKCEMQHVFYKTTPIDGKIGFEVNYNGETVQLLPEQVTAAMFQKLKEIAENGMDGLTRVTDCVIGCPAHWTDVQRRAMLDAAKIAGLNVLRLMNESTAVALQYGLKRSLPAEAHKVLFVDMGATQTTATVVSFTAGKLNVLATSTDSLGGRDLDMMLMKHFAQHIKDKYKGMDVWSNPKAMLKLRKECARVKLVLSANQKVPFRVEYIMNDTDVQGMIERPEFEAMVKEQLLGRFMAVVQKTMDLAKVTKEELFACEIVGGALRVPIMKTELSNYIGKTLSQTCDADESAALGLCYQCAMLSPCFRVKEFEVQDVTSHAVELQWGPVGSDKVEDKTLIFPEFNALPNDKMITFKDRDEAFQLTAKYVGGDGLPTGTNPIIGKYVVSGMPKTEPDQQMAKIKVKVSLNIHGVIEVTSAQLLEVLPEEKDEEMTPAPAAADADAEKPAEEAAAAPAADAKEGEEAAKKMDTSEEAGEAAKEGEEGEEKAPAAEAAAAPAEEEKKEKKDEPMKKKRKIKRVDLKVESQKVGGLNVKEMNACLEKEGEMCAQDQSIADKNAAKNSLESYVLEMRSEIEGHLGKYIEPSAGAAFCSQMTDLEDWLYDDGENAQKSEYNAKIAELKKIGDPVQYRNAEAQKRPDLIASLKKEIGHWEKLANSLEDKYQHIEEEQKKKVIDECKKTDEWLCAESIKQDALKLYEDVVLTTKILTNKGNALNKMAAKIMNKKKPPPPKPKEEEKPKEAAPEAAPDADMKPAEGAEDAAAKPAEGAEKVEEPVDLGATVEEVVEEEAKPVEAEAKEETATMDTAE